MSTDNSALELQLKAKERELQTALEEFKDYKDENEEYLVELENDNKFKEKEIESLTKKIDLNSKKLEENKKEINHITIIMEREKQRAEKKTEEFNTLKSQFIVLEQYVENLENQLRQSNFESEDIKDKFDTLEEVFILQREYASEALTLKEEELERLRQESLDFRTEINVLKSQLEKTQENKEIKLTLKQETTPKKELNSEKTLRSLYLMSLFKITSNYKTVENEPVSIVPPQEQPKSAEYYRLVRSQSVHKPQAPQISSRRKTVNQDGRKSSIKTKQMYEGFVSSRVMNKEVTQEINQVFKKIKMEIESALNNKVEIVKLSARIEAEEKTKSQLKKRIDCLVQELSDQKTLNIKISKELAGLKNFVNKNYANHGNTETDDLKISDKELKTEIEQKDSVIKTLDETLLELERELQELRSSNSPVSISSFSPSEMRTKTVYPPIQVNTSNQSIKLNPSETARFERENQFKKTPKSKQGFDSVEIASNSPTLETRMETNEFVGSRNINSFSLSPADKNSQNIFSYFYPQGLLTEFPNFLKLNGKQIEMILDQDHGLNMEKNKDKLNNIQASFDEVLESSQDIKHMIMKNTLFQEDNSHLNKNLLFLIYGKQACNQLKIQQELLDGLIDNFKSVCKEPRFQGRKQKIMIAESIYEAQDLNLNERCSNKSKQVSLSELEESSNVFEFLGKSEDSKTKNQVTIDFIIKETARTNCGREKSKAFSLEDPQTNLFKLRAVIIRISDVKDVEIFKNQIAANSKDYSNVSEIETEHKNLSNFKNFEKHAIFSVSPVIDSAETVFDLLLSVQKINYLLTEQNILILPFSRSNSQKSVEEVAPISDDSQIPSGKNRDTCPVSSF